MLAHPSSLPIVLAGPDAEALVAKAHGRALVVAHIREIDSAETMAEAALIAALEGRPIVFEGLEDVEPGERPRLLRAIERRGERVVVSAPEPRRGARARRPHVAADRGAAPSFAERQRRVGAGVRRGRTRATSPRSSGSRSGRSSRPPRSRGSPPPRAAPARPSRADLDLGARQASSSRLGELATRIPPGYTWDDLVVPDRQRELLQSISAYLRHRDRVLSEWGYEKTVARTQGLKVLFAGESGTGKTMSAQVLAAELGLEMFRVDLATIVSKYIGETEKNLDRIFNAAEGSNAILFFDEADALFGKRSEISDSHDRYANIEVAYLLQKMEGYPGAVILATNYRRNIDDAFVRRLDFVIDYPFPEAEDRERIWALVLPDTAPLADDIDLALPRRELQAVGRRDQELLAVGRVPGGRRRRRDRDAPPRPRGRAGVRQAGPADARGRLRALPRADPGAEWRQEGTAGLTSATRTTRRPSAEEERPLDSGTVQSLREADPRTRARRSSSSSASTATPRCSA